MFFYPSSFMHSQAAVVVRSVESGAEQIEKLINEKEWEKFLD